DYFECKLIDYANRYAVQPERLAGAAHQRKTADDHPFIRRNPDKCILCGLCVRICDEVVGATALGLVDRGFDTIVKPSLDRPLNETDCIACGQCVHVCPTGALTETLMIEKQVPTRALETQTVCSFCSVGCQTKLTHTGDLLLRALPVAEDNRDALLCMKGRFGFGEIARADRLTRPLIRNAAGSFEAVPFETAYTHAAKRLQAVKAVYGPDSVAIAVSDRYTNEEVFLIKEYAQKALGTRAVFSLGKARGGLADTLGADASTADFDGLEQTGLVLLIESDIRSPHAVAGLRVRKAFENGAEIIALNSFESAVDEYASMRLDPGSDLSLLKGILKAVMDLSGAGKEIPGYEALREALGAVSVSPDALKVAGAYVKAKKAVIIFEQNRISADAARLVGDIALCGGHAGGARSGVIQLKPGANAQGLADLGVGNGEDLIECINRGVVKGLVIFGEDSAAFDASALDFLAVQDLQLTRTAQKAELVLPARSFAEGAGTFTSAVGKVQSLKAAVSSPIPVTTIDIIKGLAKALGYDMPYRDGRDVILPERTIQPVNLAQPDGNALARTVANTNALYNSLMAFAKSAGL
ncbi:MAG: molybdopterin-dependent oxidoreductase, partial [Oscillospiraceae bacterium]|nr:molybdopterin-dependent oxidoreductase [Oscillospiraceae bacterium]